MITILTLHMNKLVAICVIFAKLASVALAQPRKFPPSPNQPPKPEQLFFRSGQRFLSKPLRSLYGNNNVIYVSEENKNEKQYFYIPPMLIDFNEIRRQVDASCQSGAQPKSEGRFEATVDFYNDEILSEMKQQIAYKEKNNDQKDQNNISIGIPPSAGIIVFVFDKSGKPNKVLSTIIEDAVLSGYELTTVSSGPSRRDKIRMVGTCSQLLDISSAHNIRAFLVATGTTAKTNNMSIVASIISDSNFKSELNNAESSVDRKTVSSSGGSSGLSVHIGPIGFGSNNTEGTTSVENVKYRIINRDWLHNAIDRKLSTLDIKQICESEACGNEQLRDAVISTVFGNFSEEMIRVDKRGEMLWAINTSKGDIPIGKIIVSDDIKSALNSAQNMADEHEFEIDGIKGKKRGDLLTTSNQEITWKRSGDEWIPTSMKAHIYDTNQTNITSNAAYSQVIFGRSASVAMPMQTIYIDEEHNRDIARQYTIKSVYKSLNEFFINNKERIRERLYSSSPFGLSKSVSNDYNAPERVANIIYKNEKKTPIMLSVGQGMYSSFCDVSVKIDGFFMAGSYNLVRGYDWQGGWGVLGSQCAMRVLVPAGSTYEVLSADSASNLNWNEIEM